MTWRGTIGLIAVLGALLAALWWGEERAPAPAEPAPVPLLAAASAATVLDIHAAGMTHRFVRDGDRWRAAAGRPTPNVGPLLEVLRSLAPLMVVDEDPGDPGQFGLGPDAVRLVAWHDETPLLDLEIGARNPAWTAVYVRRHGARAVEMVGALLTWELAKVLAPTATGNTLTKLRESREPSKSPPAKEAP